MFTEPTYARSGDLHIAYRTVGDGSRDFIVVSNWFTNVETLPELPSVQPWLEKMTTLGRVVFFDQPGTGLSDPVSPDQLPTLEQWSDSITAVLDALDSSEAVLLAIDGSFATAALFAATHPARTTALIVLDGYAQAVLGQTAASEAGLDALSGQRPSAFLDLDQTLEAFGAFWGKGELQHLMNPDMPWNEEIRASWARQERIAAPPGTWRITLPLLTQLDVRDVLDTIRVPTLVLHHMDDAIIPIEMGRLIARKIPGAKMVELPGRNTYLFVEPGWRRAFEEISEFLTGVRPEPAEDDRVLATVLFTDIVGSTRRAAEMGDRDWRALLDAHDSVVRAQLARFRGREVGTAGDSFLATFDGPQRAIRCALAIREALRPLEIEIRAGLHTGECEVRGDNVGGIAVHIGARVSALAAPEEILVSGTLRDLVVGSGLAFEDRGPHELKGVPGEWRLFAVTG